VEDPAAANVTTSSFSASPSAFAAVHPVPVAISGIVHAAYSPIRQSDAAPGDAVRYVAAVCA
jgi:hypothetical protein